MRGERRKRRENPEVSTAYCGFCHKTKEVKRVYVLKNAICWMVCETCYTAIAAQYVEQMSDSDRIEFAAWGNRCLLELG